MLVIAAMLVGAIVPAQTAINTRLRESVGSPIAAGFFSFIIGFAVSAILALIVTGDAIPDLALAAAQPRWVWLGGFMGVAFIVGNILLFPRIGSVETVILPILGQVTMGLIYDLTGLFESPLVPVGPLRVLGALIVVGGIALVLEIGRGAVTTRAQATGISLWLWRVFGVLIGMGSATQTAVNGYLGGALHSPMPASVISLGVGVILLALLTLGWKAPRRALLSGIAPGPWWMWLGGVLGALFVVGGATLSPMIGTGTTVIGSLVGSIICGQVIESLGWGNAERGLPPVHRIIGLVLVIIGVIMVRAL
ncbi:DMT family transporter [Corynebacterium sp. KPL2895]|uniref:DMT family transporter n=1 Tax=Corynebacterium sp. KPL2895 TaxID=3158320 RepID=UPI0032EAA534